jgi:lysozyme
MLRDFMRKYMANDSDVPSKKVNLLFLIIFWCILCIFGIFTSLVKNQHIFDTVTDALMVIICTGTVGVAAVDLIRNRRQPIPVPEPTPGPAPAPPITDDELKPVVMPEPAPTASNVDLYFIGRHEGCRLDAYLCPGGRWTIGYGSTVHQDGTNRPVKKGDSITQEQADAYLIVEANKRLNQMGLPLTFTRNQRTACLSWQYNCGQAAWMKSKLRQLILSNAGRDAIYNQWTTTYITANGKKLRGLVTRRKEEAELFFA